MCLTNEVLLTVVVGLAPIWIACLVGAICWAARYFGGDRNDNR